MLPKMMVIDPNPMHGEILKFMFRKVGFHVIYYTDVESALNRLVKSEYHLVIVDNFPEVSGLSLIRNLRINDYNGLIVFMTKRLSEEVEMKAFEFGSDAYIPKSYSPRVLIAHISALLRRFMLQNAPLPYDEEVIIVGSNSKLFLTDSSFVSCEIKPVRLTWTECRILEILMRNRGATVPTYRIYEFAWGIDCDGLEYRVKTHIRRLREKIEPEPSKPRYIHTFRGIGYRFCPPDDY